MRCLVLLGSETGRVDRWRRDARSMMSTWREEIVVVGLAY